MHEIILIGGPLNGQTLKVENKPKILPIRHAETGKKAIYTKFDSRTYKYQESKHKFYED